MLKIISSLSCSLLCDIVFLRIYERQHTKIAATFHFSDLFFFLFSRLVSNGYGFFSRSGISAFLSIKWVGIHIKIATHVIIHTCTHFWSRKMPYQAGKWFLLILEFSMNFKFWSFSHRKIADRGRVCCDSNENPHSTERLR